jgi:hypothetical protein
MLPVTLRAAMIATTICAATLSGAPAFAQTAPAQTAPAPAATAAITPGHLQAAREVVIGSGIVRTFEAIPQQFAEEARQTFSTTRPEIMKDLNDVLKGLEGDFTTQRDEMVTTAARVFALRLTEPELKEIGTFFKSAAGKRYVETQPQMLDEMFGEMQTWTQKLSDLMITRIRAEMKKRGHDI